MIHKISILLTGALLLLSSSVMCAADKRPAPKRVPIGQTQFQPRHRYVVDQNEGVQMPATLQSFRQAAAPRQLPGTESGVYGYLGYASFLDRTPAGFYAVPFDDAPVMQWQDTQTWSPDLKMTIGWLNGDKLCGIVEQAANFTISVYKYVEYDFSQGDLLIEKNIPLKDNMTAFLRVGAYNENDGCVYGYGLAADKFNTAWTKAPVSDLTQATPLHNLDWDTSNEECVALCFNPDDNMFYGLNKAKNLVRITPEGKQTVIAQVPLNNLIDINSGMMWSHRDNAIIINFNMRNDASCLYMVTLTDDGADFTLLQNYDNGEQFYYFVSPFTMQDPTLPARPEIASNMFDSAQGALNGIITVKMPTTMADGNALSGTLTMKATVDGDIVKESAAEPGATVSVPLMLTRGMHVVRFYAVKDGRESRACYLSGFFGEDDPCSPEEVRYDQATQKVDWTPVTTSAHGGYIDAKEIAYHVYLNGEEVEGSPTTSNSMIVALPQDLPYAAYKFAVAADFRGNTSELTEAAPVACGNPLDLDVTILPTQAQADMMTVIPGDNDFENSWHLETLEDGTMWFNSNCKAAKMADFLVLPPITFPSADKVYSIDLDAALSNTQYTKEQFQVFIGTKPTRGALTTKIMDTQSPTVGVKDGSNHFSSIFTVPEAGTYYVALKCISEKWQWGLMVRNITVAAQEGTTNRPEAPTLYQPVAATQGKLTATLKMKAPTKLLNGETIAADAELEAHFVCADTTTVKCKPGETVEAEVNTLQGNNVISVSCAYNGNEGLVATRSVYTGVDVPGPPTNLQSAITEDGRGVKLTWTPPTQGINGGYIDPEGLTYKIMVMSESFYTDNPKPEFTINVPEDRDQALYYYAVVARNVAGECNNFAESWSILGKSYDLPAAEDFTDNYVDYKPVTVMAGNWEIGQPVKYVPEAAANDYALIGNPNLNDAYGRVALPRFSTEDCQGVDLKVNLWNGNGSGAPVLKLCCQRYGQPDMELGAFAPEDNGWTSATISLPAELLGLKWVWPYLYVESYGSAAYPMLISGYELTKTDGSSITAIHSHNAETTYYDLQGRYRGHSLRNLAPGIYLRATEEGTSKVIVR